MSDIHARLKLLRAIKSWLLLYEIWLPEGDANEKFRQACDCLRAPLFQYHLETAPLYGLLRCRTPGNGQKAWLLILDLQRAVRGADLPDTGVIVKNHYDMHDLKEMIGLGNRRINELLKEANIRTAGVGQKNCTWTPAEVYDLLIHIYQTPGMRGAVKDHCEAALEHFNNTF